MASSMMWVILPTCPPTSGHHFFFVQFFNLGHFVVSELFLNYSEVPYFLKLAFFINLISDKLFD